jgi:hypothetical protein
MLNKLKPIVLYVRHRRGRFTALGTFLVMYPLVRRPRHNWTELERDFRLYDELSKKK